jgi:hypothetical protein
MRWNEAILLHVCICCKENCKKELHTNVNPIASAFFSPFTSTYLHTGWFFLFCFVSPSNRIGQTGTTPLSIPSSGLAFVLGGSFVPTRPIVKRQPPITSPFLVAA